jgi:hypothetical protein
VLLFGIAAAGAVTVLPGLGLRRTTARRAGVFAGVLLVLTALAGPTAYSFTTISEAHAGALPTAGPAGAGGFGGRGGMGGPPGGATGRPPGGATGGPGAPTGGPGATTGGPGATTGGTPRGGGGMGGGGMGGFLGGGGTSAVSSELITFLQQGAKGYTWAAAAVTANGAAPVQIAAEVPVMAIGGFNGTDPAPSLAEFQQLVAQGKVHYFVGSGGGGFGGGRGGTSSEISTWVEQNFQSQTIGSTTVYDLTTT